MHLEEGIWTCGDAFDAVVKQLTAGISAGCNIGINIIHPHVSHPIQIPFLSVQQLEEAPMTVQVTW